MCSRCVLQSLSVLPTTVCLRCESLIGFAVYGDQDEVFKTENETPAAKQKVVPALDGLPVIHEISQLSQTTNGNKPVSEHPIEIDVHQTQRALEQSPAPLLIDCREPSEYDLCRIDGAVLIPMGEIPARIDELTPQPNQSLIVYCHHGVRSLHVTRWLRANGLAQAQSMSGGIDAWSTDVDPQVPRY